MATTATRHGSGENALRCSVCDEPLRAGERREAYIRRNGVSGTRHWVCSSVDTPPTGILGSLTEGDLFEVEFNHDSDWHYATVQETAVCGGEYVIRARLEDVVYAEENMDNPLQFSDEFDVVVDKQGNAWSDPLAFDVESDWPSVDDGVGRSFEYETHRIGDVTVRPTVLHAAQYDWEWWGERPTDPRDLYERYCIAGETTYEIGDALGVSDRTIRRWMDRAGIERTPKH